MIDIRLLLSLYVRFREGNIFFSNYRASFFLLRYLGIFRVIKWIRIEKFDKSSICFDLFLTIAVVRVRGIYLKIKLVQIALESGVFSSDTDTG